MATSCPSPQTPHCGVGSGNSRLTGPAQAAVAVMSAATRLPVVLGDAASGPSVGGINHGFHGETPCIAGQAGGKPLAGSCANLGTTSLAAVVAISSLQFAAMACIVSRFEL